MFFSFFLSHSKQFIKSGPQKTFCSTFIIFRHSYSAHIKKGRYLYSTLLLRHYTLRKRRKLFSSFYLFFRYYSKVAGRSVSRPRPEYKCAIPDLYYYTAASVQEMWLLLREGGPRFRLLYFSTKEKQKPELWNSVPSAPV